MAFNVELKVEHEWELLMDIDNASNSAPIKKEVNVESQVFISYQDMVRSLKVSTEGASLGLDVGIFDITCVGVKGELNMEVKSEYEKIAEAKTERDKRTSRIDTYEIGGSSSLKLYQLIFKGPGLTYVTDTLSSSPDVIPDIFIRIKGNKIPVLKDIDVIYTNEPYPRPGDLIQEARGYDPDINLEWNELMAHFRAGNYAGHFSKYVWLRPIWTEDVSEGVTGIQVAVQHEPDESYQDQDLAKGSGGAFRYLKMERDPESNHRITEVALWRRPFNLWSRSGPTENYRFNAEINGGRSGQKVPVVNGRFNVEWTIPFEELFLVWNGREIQ